MIDLNPTRFKTSESAKSVREAIDAALIEKAQNDKRRTYLGASAIGAGCERRTQYEFMGVDYDADYIPSARTQRIFTRGHIGEDMVADWLRLAGYDLSTEKPDGYQYGFSVADGRFKGHCDGIIKGGPGIETPCIWENKILGVKSFGSIERNGVRKAKPEYFAQIQIYQAYLNLPAPACFTALNADSCELYIEFVPFCQKTAQEVSDKAVAIIQDTGAGALRARISDDPSFWMCSNKSGKCPFWGRCHAS